MIIALILLGSLCLLLLLGVLVLAFALSDAERRAAVRLSRVCAEVDYRRDRARAHRVKLGEAARQLSGAASRDGACL